MASRDQTQIDPNVGIPELIRRLADDSKRLASDEVHLAKLELSDSVHTAGRGGLRLAVAFGAGVVALTALTVFMAAALGRLLGDRNYWLGALLTGLIELGVAFYLIKRGIRTFGQPSYTLAETRESLKETAAWVRAPRAD